MKHYHDIDKITQVYRFSGFILRHVRCRVSVADLFIHVCEVQA